ncbi:MAG TPA: flagellar hook-basal body complex protein FliE [Candidatus Aquicultor sp.]|jgi:flagellar hook-basal body complex protein FliE
MQITPSLIKPISIGTKEQPESQSAKAIGSFADMFNDTIKQTDEMQKNADNAVQKFVAGEIDISDVMIETEKASTALQLTIQLRNKVVEAYQEVMRMQI